MQSRFRTLAFVLLAGLALPALGCGSNNKSKIEGKWKVLSMPDKGKKGRDDFGDEAKKGQYVYLEFHPDGTAGYGIGADDPAKLEQMRAAAPGQKLAWDFKYKLHGGDTVEFYEMTKDLPTGSGAKDRKVTIKIDGNDMTMTDSDGTATLTKMQ